MSENNNEVNALPILYSLRNCPYAMRARIAIFKAKQKVLLRDLVLTNKPSEMIMASPKATVPILVLANKTVLDESLDVMLWALNETDPDDLLQSDSEDALLNMLKLINEFDNGFKSCLDQYKCAKRYRNNSDRDDNLIEHRDTCEQYLQKLESRLNNHLFLMSDKESLADIALLPFIRQFARVERQWYLQSPYPKVRQWLNNYLQSPMFTKVMAKHSLWVEHHIDVVFTG